MNQNKISALKLPRMRLTEACQDDLKTVFAGLLEAQNQFSVLQSKEGDLKIFHSELNEELFVLLMAALHRNVFMYEFFKMALIVIEKFREGDLEEATEFMQRAIEYIQIKNNKKINL
jgi:hypothetical protein